MVEASSDKKNRIDKDTTSCIKMEKEKIVFKGTHPDSLYRVPVSSGVGAGNMARVLRALRWPTALILVCTALAVFVYFLMPDNLESDANMANSTIWQSSFIGAGGAPQKEKTHKQRPPTMTENLGKKSKPVEIDFYDAENKENADLVTIQQQNQEVKPIRKLPVPPVYPDHIAPEVQYGNEKADADKNRSAKNIDEKNNLPEDSTLKPHITQKPERPLAIYFKDVVGGLRPETITRAETVNDFEVYEKSRVEGSKGNPTQYRVQEEDVVIETEPEKGYFDIPQSPNGNFTSGHSKFFGIGIEDVENMKSTTQSSVYNTRVSPTLPTWRDRDDSTTKNYPLNLNTDVRQCRSPSLALCRGVLPYDLAGPPPTLGKMEVTALLPQMEYLVASNCSDRTRLFMCSVLEPECNPPPFPPKMPCYNLCKAVADSCEAQIPAELAPVFNCKRYESINCLNARGPCTNREMSCNDGVCIQKEWICDGKKDCIDGEDESICNTCSKTQFRCHSGSCVSKRWVCDGYLDCPDGDDEAEQLCSKVGTRSETAKVTDEEPGEEPAGSAPAPSVRRPNKIHDGRRRTDKIGDDSSKELLMTSDSNNALKRNFTRRPPSSRLTPYSKPKIRPLIPDPPEDDSSEVTPSPTIKSTTAKSSTDQSMEDINIGDLHFFDDEDKLSKDENFKSSNSKFMKDQPLHMPKNTVAPKGMGMSEITRSKSKLTRVIDGDAILQKAAQELEMEKARLRNITEPEDFDRPKSSHTSPCPSGELRCVDGKCITLAQLCDGTIDCTDHADEDNCYT